VLLHWQSSRELLPRKINEFLWHDNRNYA